MTGRKFLHPPLLWLAPQSDRGSAARAETDFQYGPPQSFFELSALQKARARAQISQPPLLWLAPQSDHGSAARAETEAFFQYGPPQSDCGGGRLPEAVRSLSWIKETLNPAKGKSWVVRGGGNACARRPDAPGVEARALSRQTLNPKP